MTSATSNFTDQMALQKNLTSNQSSDIKDIKKLTSEEVELLKSLGQGFSKTSTQSQFSVLGIFLLGISLLIYGLRLTLKATDRQTSKYFKAMIWALITPVIVLIAIYQIGILLGAPILIYKADEPFFLISLTPLDSCRHNHIVIDSRKEVDRRITPKGTTTLVKHVHQ